jgi:hypothetical protein
MYKVYHRQPLYPGLVFLDQEAHLPAILGWPSNYRAVARVEADSLEEVFARTQHLETAWWHNPGVKALEISRSTSIGDIIQNEQGDLFAVTMTGFAKVSDRAADP